MDIQKQSPFLSLPLEIRNAIYADLVPKAVHISLRHGRVSISTCIEPKIGRYQSGIERRPPGDHRSETLWARRLQSSWGPHWQCEEVAQMTKESIPQSTHPCVRNVSAMSILFLCKKIHTDVSEWLSHNAVFHVTDLDTLCELAQLRRRSDAPHSPYGFLSAVTPSIRKLSIILRLPLPVFQVLGSDIDLSNPPHGHHGNNNEYNLASMWRQVWPLLALQLAGLRRVSLWLDHDESRSWCLVNERRVLSPFINSLPPDKLTMLDGVTLNLPNLHPRDENPELHFTQDSPQPPAHFTISRRLRQRYYYDETSSGYDRVSYVPDFPLLLEFRDWEGSGFESMTFEEIEEFERLLWKRGDDVDLLISEATGPVCQLTM
ncbi:hypothetical protein BR93DRAFT_930952 [Coniochaeta sp. PMI_546]|nr:hypothetical protein BR93DRAFT_930952 [Coniochaeta sp. PMI_546]